ncbi:MAG: hypothetical protein Q7U47_02450 [Paludibacter sp.]|nr:hypothetical protein [Paludibacter sp.]
MNKSIIIALFFVGVLSFDASAQKGNSTGEFGNTLNLGLGIGGYYGYYGNVGGSLPVFNINYELDVAKDFTLAPFITFYSYRNNTYYYQETVIPVGCKGTYYFDRILNAGSKWDFYLAGSLGYSIVKTTWDNGYYRYSGYNDVNPLFLDLHVGTEFHLSNKIGLFLDISSGVSTIGIAFH